MTQVFESKNNIAVKKEGNLNALVHGFYAREIVLPWESAEEFEQLHEDLKKEWSPSGRTEQETVLGLTSSFWIKRRLTRTWDLGFRKDPLVQEIAKSGKKSWAEIHDYLRDGAKVNSDAFRIVNDLYSKMKIFTDVLHEEAATKREGSEWDKFIALESEMQLKMGQIHSFIQPLQVQHPPNRTEIFDQAYLPEVLEKIVSLEAALDARIDKAIARLVNLKEYKKLTGANKAPLLVSQGLNLVPEVAQSKVVEQKNATKQ